MRNLLKKTKRIIILLIVVFTAMIFANSNKSSAASGNKYFGLQFQRDTGYIYQAISDSLKIFKVREYQTSSGTGALDSAVYCIKGGPGFGSSDMAINTPSTVVNYTQYYNLKDKSSIPTPYSNSLPSNTNSYKALVWLLDNIYVPAESTATAAEKQAAEELRKKLLEAAGIDSSSLLYGTSADIIDIIEVVQQAAIWHFTNNNPQDKYYANFLTVYRNRSAGIDANYKILGDEYIYDDDYIEDDVSDLFEYLIDTATAKGPTYNPVTASTTPVKMTPSSLYMAESGSYYVAGPYKIEELISGLDYDMNITIKNQNGTDITNNVIILNSSQYEVSGANTNAKIKSLVGQNFYIKIPNTSTSISVRLDSSYSATTQEAWFVSNSPANQQPLVLVKKEKKSFYTTVYGYKPKEFDLALRKFITSINGTAPTTSREPTISQTELDKLSSETITTVDKVHTKTPLEVNTGDKVIYKIRIYNEGTLDGYATEVTDYLPEGLEFVPAAQSTINTKYGWIVDGTGKVVKTEYLKDRIVPKYNYEGVSYLDLEIECKVVATTKTTDQTLKNIAEITKDRADIDGDLDDRDSTPNNLTQSQKDNYGTTSKEDDDDFEDLKLPGVIPKTFDLALRKFITSVNGTAPSTSREPTIAQSELQKLAAGTITTVNKVHPKDPISVNTGDKVVYTLRIYNEGETDGFATEIVDYLPAGLEFVPAAQSTINTKYGWTVDGTGRIVKTTNVDDLFIKAFDKNTLKLSYVEVQIECKVVATVTTNAQTLKNIAEISEDQNDSDLSDRDSTPDNLTQSQKDNYGTTSKEDDDDFEDLRLPGYNPEFDLALRKFITSINGVPPTTSREPTIAQSELQKLADGTVTTVNKVHPKNPLLVNTGDKVIYKIRIYNEGELPGLARGIVDYLPEGLEFVPAAQSTINTKYGWTVDGTGKIVKTKYLEDDYIYSFDKNTLSLYYKEVEIECKVVATEGVGSKTLKNIAEISKDLVYEESDIPDRDSEPDNLTQSQKDNYGTTSKEDDDDFEDLRLPGRAPEFDLALRKFITSINGTTPSISREPTISQEELQKLADGTVTTVKKEHPKTPLLVKTGDKVVYKLRIYNEGETDGFATEIVDYLPEGLEFVPAAQSTINTQYLWIVDGTGKIVKTDYLKESSISAFNKETLALSYIDIEIECRVIATSSKNEKTLKNIAEISKDLAYYDGDLDDRDSTPDNLTQSQKDNYGTTSKEDDDDFEDLFLQSVHFDLALRKFIVKVNGEAPETSREPQITLEELQKLADGTVTTVKKEHSKVPILVNTGDTVIYSIRVYNEGSMDGFANEIVDYLPDGLEFVEDSDINKQFFWTVDSTGKIVKSDYLKDTLLPGFNKETLALSFVDIQIECRVTAELLDSKQTLKNVAEISDDSDDDRDSTPESLTPEDVKDYGTTNKEDDDDFEDLILPEKPNNRFDLALRKFITGVNDEIITNREPQVDKSKFGTTDSNGKNITDLIYNHTKDPVRVEHNDTIIYTIRVYNEGNVAGYAAEVKDDVPDGLLFLADNDLNKEYRWKMYDANGNETTDATKAKYIRTDYLSKEQEDTTEENLLAPFDPDTMFTPDYRDVKVAFKVTIPNTSDRIITNKADITKDTDEDGNDVPDIDSTPDEWNEGEDDQDIEHIYVKYFDLALRKWVSHVIIIENGQQAIRNTGHTPDMDPEPVVKVELNNTKLDDITVKFRYGIRITNEGEIAGYATEITDYIPEGLMFEQADNPKWRLKEDGVIVTDQLKDTLLQPGESATIEVTLTWIKRKDNLGLKVNIAEISEDKNDSDTPDIDSTPNNKVPGEDDIDDAPVILSIKTGSEITYVGITSGVLSILGVGIFLIKKFVI